MIAYVLFLAEENCFDGDEFEEGYVSREQYATRYRLYVDAYTAAGTFPPSVNAEVLRVEATFGGFRLTP